MKLYYIIFVLKLLALQLDCGILLSHLRDLLNDEYFHNEDGYNDIQDENLPKNGELFEGDIVMDEGLRRTILGSNKRSVVYDSEYHHKKHWPGGVVPYKISDTLKPVIKEQVFKAIEELHEFTCINYRPKVDSDEDYVMFTDGDGCSSNVGRKGGMQEIHLGIFCKRIGTVLHEMMHALGIVHEQSRYDRDSYVKVHFENIKSRNRYNFFKYNVNELDNMDMPYNYYSVMHYSNDAFSKNFRPTLESKIYPKLQFGQRDQLSHLDVVQINKLYKCNDVLRDDRSPILHDDMTAQQAMDMRDTEELHFPKYNTQIYI